jgi:hypothetical protein
VEERWWRNDRVVGNAVLCSFAWLACWKLWNWYASLPGPAEAVPEVSVMFTVLAQQNITQVIHANLAAPNIDEGFFRGAAAGVPSSMPLRILYSPIMSGGAPSPGRVFRRLNRTDVDVWPWYSPSGDLPAYTRHAERFLSKPGFHIIGAHATDYVAETNALSYYREQAAYHSDRTRRRSKLVNRLHDGTPVTFGAAPPDNLPTSDAFPWATLLTVEREIREPRLLHELKTTCAAARSVGHRMLSVDPQIANTTGYGSAFVYYLTAPEDAYGAIVDALGALPDGSTVEHHERSCEDLALAQ